MSTEVFVVIEMADVELTGVAVFSEKDDAMTHFMECSNESMAGDWDYSDLSHEVDGTLAAAGDDAYSVQVIRKEVVA